jgi:hypothetical protein
MIMIVKPLLKNAPVIGSCYGFSTTAVKAYNCSTPSGAIVTAAKGIVIDCTSSSYEVSFFMCCFTWMLRSKFGDGW